VASGKLPILQVGSAASTNTVHLGGGVDGYEYELSFLDGGVNVCGKEEVPAREVLEFEL
jgi:hypothetical protein